ncbi:DNA-binding protein [Streptacidiphilus pinicola]|uniref:DNA-binding protein n=1 Tax=Streptacidiphilus pinicola TaxID=2219663 RepID=A0A2X0JW58_9ACTN|nr:Bro-N domain-containing protein [Streptacidiphilus pinicola]RAG81165.1 DNA-binding protein [Streptacidiphilus pinicola]
MADAININDFVHAATGARVRRVTLSDGSHWFPSADLCRELGYANPSDALRRHVPEPMRCVAATLVPREGWLLIAGQGIKKSSVMVSLQGLLRLVNGCVKPQCEPFKNWVTEVLLAIQQEGAYRLGHGETAVVLPQPVMDVIVRLEERNLQLDAEFAATQREQQRLLRELVTGVNRIADAMERPAVPTVPAQRAARTAEEVLAKWRGRLTVTEDVWSVAAHIVPIALAQGMVRRSVESMALATGLTQERVRDCLRFLQKRACIRQVGTEPDGTPAYRLAAG